MIKLGMSCSSCARKDELDHRCTECDAPLCTPCWEKAHRFDETIRVCPDCERVYDEVEIDY